MTATVHMVCGPVGAGKTTYARAYARDQRAALFVIDEWMAELFTMDAPRPLTLEWMLPRVLRCEARIWATVHELAGLGVASVVELGFYTRAQRDRFRARASAAAVPLLLHSISAPREVRRGRVERRNRGGDTLTIEVDAATFAWAEDYYEALADDELAAAVVIGGEVELR